jgi:hypothetical protein
MRITFGNATVKRLEYERLVAELGVCNLACGCENYTQCQLDMSVAIVCPSARLKALPGTARQECLMLRGLNFV